MKIGDSMKKLVADKFSLDGLHLRTSLEGQAKVRFSILKDSIDVPGLIGEVLCEFIGVAASDLGMGRVESGG